MDNKTLPAGDVDNKQIDRSIFYKIIDIVED